MDQVLMDMQRAYMLELYHEPLHAGSLKEKTGSATSHNQSCGDIVQMDVLVASGVLQNAAHSGHGCAISKAATSLVLDEYIGKQVEDLQQITFETVKELLGIPISHTRHKCAMIGVKALKQAIQ
ncbi:MAG: iron-sulfur cluster assembly scaffold protein [Candidatus Magasanikbacteria bacterium]|jgi:nitrogen fixation protein NifU and related proteins|nr:iron-sulfur cluster assembly scaffold protein [Candidatus Magasanikbacteria bacterium]